MGYLIIGGVVSILALYAVIVVRCWRNLEWQNLREVARRVMLRA
jgi:hypothetical protein